MEEKISFNKLNSTIKFQKSILDLAKSTNTKLVYGFTKNNKALQKIASELEEKLSDKKIDLCLTDSTGAILLNNDQSYKYSKEGVKELNAYIKLLNEEEITFDFYKVKFSDLSDLEKSTFLDSESNFLVSIQEEEKTALNYIICDFPDNLK